MISWDDDGDILFGSRYFSFHLNGFKEIACLLACFATPKNKKSRSLEARKSRSQVPLSFGGGLGGRLGMTDGSLLMVAASAADKNLGKIEIKERVLSGFCLNKLFVRFVRSVLNFPKTFCFPLPFPYILYYLSNFAG